MKPKLIKSPADYKIEVSRRNLKPTPIENMMASNLLMEDINFYTQYKKKFGIDGGTSWRINGHESFIADFYLPHVNIIIETEGRIHLEPERVLQDINRQNAMTAMGYRVFRFNWDDTMDNSRFDVIEQFVSPLKSVIEGDWADQEYEVWKLQKEIKELKKKNG